MFWAVFATYEGTVVLAFISVQNIHYFFLFSHKNGLQARLPRRASAHAPLSYSDDEMRCPYAVDEDVPHGDGAKVETKVQQSGSTSAWRGSH